MIRKLLLVVVLLAVIGSLWLFARTRPVLVDLAPVARGGVRIGWFVLLFVPQAVPGDIR